MLYVFIALLHLYLIHILANQGRGIFLLAYQEHIVFLGNDKAIKTIEYGKLALRHLHHRIMAILDDDVAVYHHIVILALLHRLIDTVPGTQVGPSEIAFHHAGIGWLVQYAKIYRDVRIGREALLHIGILRLYAELRIFLIVLTKHGRQNLAEALTQMLDIA